MGDDDFKPFDINALHRRAQTSEARDHTKRQLGHMTVMEQQRRRQERPKESLVAAEPIVEGRDGDRPCWILMGQPVRDGAVLEVYTNKANGYMRGQVLVGPWPERPRLMVTLWNPWGRDVDGLHPRVGTWEVELMEGVRCRFTGALPQEID